ncbi:MAG: alkaline phosphatase [Blastocatellales bacterium]
MKKLSITRRDFLFTTAVPLVVNPFAEGAPYNAMGERIGEVTESTAIVHTRLTAYAERNNSGYVFRNAVRSMPHDKLPRMPEGMRVDDLEGACPGKAGRVRLHYSTRRDLSRAQTTRWFDVGPDNDFTHRFNLTGLRPYTRYWFAVEMKPATGDESRRGETGTFRTAPRARDWRPIRFCASTCQHFLTRDDPKGYLSYLAMRRLDPDFTAMIGDNVYYDSEPPIASTVELARHFWHRTYSLPSLVDYYRNTPGYWTKDDHDVLKDDCWPGVDPGIMAPMTFEDGLRIFGEQVPIGDPPYRRFRWGRGLEIWLTEGRDFRSPNNAPDSAAKSIWGETQKAWLKKTILESDADFRILISPTPIVGPDRRNKRDNHSNDSFGVEGREFRQWAKDNRLDNFFVICGDRHWQYHSVDPVSGMQEFSVGAMSDGQAGGSPGEDKRFHRFHRVKGGFLSVELTGDRRNPRLEFRFHDVKGEIVYRHSTS